MRQIILASSSPYRKALLQRLNLKFDTFSPQVAEQAVEGEPPAKLVTRLAQAKAAALRQRFPDAFIIGSDQCAVTNGLILGKPGNFEAACTQLKRASGGIVEFHTGLCLLDARNGHRQTHDETYKVHFRSLTDQQIRNYLHHEEPYQCAGAFKAEQLGIALFERLEGDDPNAVIGLPLIRLVKMLENVGIDVI